MFQDIVSLIIKPIVPAPEISAIEWMLRDVAGEIRTSTLEVADELRNPFAFVHEAFNFSMPPMMGKPTFPEGPDRVRRRTKE
jgi:hypothetical protein